MSKYDINDSLNSGSINRRRYLSTVTSITGAATLGSQVVVADQSESNKPNTPIYPQDSSKKAGFSVGTYDEPITSNTIRRIQETVASNISDDVDGEGIVMSRPYDQKLDSQQESTDKIFGYGLKWTGRSLKAFVHEEPTIISDGDKNRPCPEAQRRIEQIVHNKTLDFINKGDY